MDWTTEAESALKEVPFFVRKRVRARVEEDARSKGYRVMLGGKLGRHPRLARELRGTYRENEAVSILERCLDFYKNHSKHGERFSEICHDAKIHGLVMPRSRETQEEGELTTFLEYYRNTLSRETDCSRRYSSYN